MAKSNVQLDEGFEEVDLTLDEGFEEVKAPEEESLGRQIVRGATASIPLLSGLGGSLLATGAALPTGPGAIAAGVAGGAGGYALGKEAEALANYYLLDDKAPSDALTLEGAKEAAKRVGGNLAEGALSEVAGLGVGALASKGIQAAGKGVAKLASGAQDVAENLALRSLGAERGTIKKIGKEKATQVARQALDEGIIKAGASTDDLIAKNKELMAKVMDERSAAYSAIDEAGIKPFSPVDTAVKIEKEVGDFSKTSPLNADRVRQLESSLEALLQRGDQTSMKEAQQIVEELQSAAKWSGVGQRTPKEELAQSIAMTARGELNEAAARGAEQAGLTGVKELIENANKTFSLGKETEKLLSNKYAREQGNKLFGLTDTIVGAGGLPLGAPQSLAFVGIKKALEKYGATTGAVTANQLSKSLQVAPELIQAVGPVIKQAMQRSGASASAIALQNFSILAQQKPEIMALASLVSKEGQEVQKSKDQYEAEALEKMINPDAQVSVDAQAKALKETLDPQIAAELAPLKDSFYKGAQTIQAQQALKEVSALNDDELNTSLNMVRAVNELKGTQARPPRLSEALIASFNGITEVSPVLDAASSIAKDHGARVARNFVRAIASVPAIPQFKVYSPLLGKMTPQEQLVVKNHYLKNVVGKVIPGKVSIDPDSIEEVVSQVKSSDGLSSIEKGKALQSLIKDGTIDGSIVKGMMLEGMEVPKEQNKDVSPLYKN